MKRLKHLLQRVFPRTYGRLQTARYKRTLRHAFDEVTADHGLVVQAGPFQGMTYTPQVATPDRLICHALLPKLLGCYEAELHETIAAVHRARYSRIVNIGCAEGYYAVGLARQDAHVRVFAFDTLPQERHLCGEMARANGVADRVTIAPECTPEVLRHLASDYPLIVCDCEGCELTLLDPTLVPALSSTDLLVELHDCVDPTISKVIPARFAPTHDVALIECSPRDLGRYEAIRRMSRYRQQLSVSEFRWGSTSWAYMTARARPA